MLCCLLKAALACRYGDYAAMFLKLLKDSDEEVWDAYYVFEQDSPTDETLAKYKVPAQSMHVARCMQYQCCVLSKTWLATTCHSPPPLVFVIASNYDLLCLWSLLLLCILLLQLQSVSQPLHSIQHGWAAQYIYLASH